MFRYHMLFLILELLTLIIIIAVKGGVHSVRTDDTTLLSVAQQGVDLFRASRNVTWSIAGRNLQGSILSASLKVTQF